MIASPLLALRKAQRFQPTLYGQSLNRTRTKWVLELRVKSTMLTTRLFSSLVDFLKHLALLFVGGPSTS